ncbi:MAG: hypothetical protein NDI75_15405 [Candidatus Didemnitutus sp.]|nr:hypothetical protein [Candidatus Didemnitutus sp.]
MGAQRDDYLLREIDRLRALVAALCDARDLPLEVERGLRLAFDLQTKLFPLPPERFLALDAATQFERLRDQLPDDLARERCATYAELLFHTATLYDFADRAELAAGARQLSLHQILLTHRTCGDEETAQLAELIASACPREELAVPVAALLDEFYRAN